MVLLASPSTGSAVQSQAGTLNKAGDRGRSGSAQLRGGPRQADFAGALWVPRASSSSCCHLYMRGRLRDRTDSGPAWQRSRGVGGDKHRGSVTIRVPQGCPNSSPKRARHRWQGAQAAARPGTGHPLLSVLKGPQREGSGKAVCSKTQAARNGRTRRESVQRGRWQLALSTGYSPGWQVPRRLGWAGWGELLNPQTFCRPVS